MYAVVTRIDDFGRPAWIALMVLGFIVFWPVGLAILAYMLWSGRMGCGRHWRHRSVASEGASIGRARGGRWERKRERWERKMQHWRHMDGHRGHGLRPSGNHAFDEYREEALRRLEEEATEFRDFLERLRAAKDRTEFDEFMRDRRNRPSGPARRRTRSRSRSADVGGGIEHEQQRPVLSDRPLFFDLRLPIALRRPRLIALLVLLLGAAHGPGRDCRCLAASARRRAVRASSAARAARPAPAP